jgi:hypothetical protein
MLQREASDYTDLDIITLVMLSVKIRAFLWHYKYVKNTTDRGNLRYEMDLTQI